MIDGEGIDEDEYFKNNIEVAAYGIYQREALWETVKKSKEEDFKKEAEKRNVDIYSVEKEYYDLWVDELVEKAEIKILDMELRKLLQ